jgi:hypothetical protein
MLSRREILSKAWVGLRSLGIVSAFAGTGFISKAAFSQVHIYRKATARHYKTIHNGQTPQIVFPFVVEKFERDEIYADPVWGIKIEKITVDNSPVLAEKLKTKSEYPNFDKIFIGTGSFIYQVGSGNLVFASQLTEKGQYNLEKFTIPARARRIEIQYRLRLSPESSGPLLTLQAIQN